MLAAAMGAIGPARAWTRPQVPEDRLLESQALCKMMQIGAIDLEFACGSGPIAEVLVERHPDQLALVLTYGFAE